MPSLFVDNFTRPLIASRSSSPGPSISRRQTEEQDSTRKHALHALYLSLAQGPRPPVGNAEDAISTLAQLDESKRLSPANDEEEALKNAVIGKLLVTLYADALDTYLSQATQVEAEAEWWADIERSRLSVALYLLQTTPIRLVNLVQTIVEKLHAHDLPLRLSTITPRSLRLLFPSPDAFRPSALTTACFPHLAHQPLSVTLVSSPSFFFAPSSPPSNGDVSRISALATTIFYYANLTLSFVTLPLALTRQECRHKRRALEKIRDERAESLGRIALLRSAIGEAMKQPMNPALVDFVGGLADTVSIPDLDTQSTPPRSKIEGSPLLSTLLLLSERTTSLAPAHAHILHTRRLLRPSRFVLLWPSLLLLPPLVVYALRSLYASRATLVDTAQEAAETISGFVKGWLIEPLRDVLKTVRAGGEEGVIVRKEGVLADLESLERMTLSLARDELHYDSAQLDALAQQIRLGDLTPILRIYEEDIRRPLRSALTGTLLRSVFIQVQKAKVDIDQALTGIDKLLKSQELTFAFVGVAPALALVYFFTTGLGRLYGITGVGKGRYGGKSQRRGVWLVMRRIERLLIIQPESPEASHTSPPISPPPSTTLSSPTPPASSPPPLPALPTGLILLSLARLRSYATAYLPPNSALQIGFLEDVADLADPAVGAQGKVRIVERMWRCWGGDKVLGWGNGGM